MVEVVEKSIYHFIQGDVEVEAVEIFVVGEAEVVDLRLKLKSLSKPNVFDLL